MIYKYKTYIKEQYNLNLDPYGEEDWEYDNLSPVLQMARQQDKPYDQIKFLSVQYKNLENLEGIENLINLETLICYNNQLTNLNGIENLTNLERLYCQNNQLTSLHGIENIVNLKMLQCGRNQLTNLNDIENLTNLIYLSCGNNLFSKEYEQYLRRYCKEKYIHIVI